MCTAISYSSGDHYFGRNLDYFHLFGEEIVITPRSFPLVFRKTTAIKKHYAIIGTAHVEINFPLYYDAVNEKGLCMAGLLFSEYAHYHSIKPRYDNIAPFEFIPWILSVCSNVKEAKELLQSISIADIPFSDTLGVSPLHWIISDKEHSITVESVKNGLFVYDNKAHVLTNAPEFPSHLFNLNNYIGLSPYAPKNTFSENLPLKNYSFGMGAIGLPGDFSSMSRFVKASFVLSNSVKKSNENDCVNHFFRILDTVAMPEGAIRNESGNCEKTLYSCCINADKGIYYYTTYSDRTIKSVSIDTDDFKDTLICTPL